jgi:hypothetical protein
MANANSTTIANIASGDKNDNRANGGRIRVKSGTALVAAADGAGSTYRLFQIRSGDHVVSVKWLTDALGAGADDVNLGLYTETGTTTIGAVVDDNILIDNADLTLIQAATTEEITNGASYTEADINEAIWERLGLSEDPFLTYDVVATIISDPAAAGNLGVVLLYTDGT